jgi:acyl-CoA synthetase (AMP-forming)/AMP-acid ligase II
VGLFGLVTLLLLGPLSVMALGVVDLSTPWYAARQGRAGLAPDPAAERGAVVQVYGARAVRWRGAFAIHPWIAVKPEGATSYTTYQVIGWRAMRGGTALVTAEGAEPDRHWYGAAPQLLAEHPAADRHDHTSLRFVIYAGAPMYREDQKAALRRLGPVIVQYFGLGEVTGNITVLPSALHDPEDGPQARPGTCGFERTGMQVSIQDDSGTELAPFETGEICVIGPAVFAGYFDNAEANAKAFRDGWFRTGDLGHMDAQGFVYITGRASDMYISGGSNIYPREIEETILTHPDIDEVAVVGVPDPTWGEVGIAVCVPRAGTAPSEEAMAAFLAPKLARYKLPRRFVFWEALPKSGYGKVPKRMVRDQLEARGVIPPAAGPAT